MQHRWAANLETRGNAIPTKLKADTKMMRVSIVAPLRLVFVLVMYTQVQLHPQPTIFVCMLWCGVQAVNFVWMLWFERAIFVIT
jgi:hypothetical protein